MPDPISEPVDQPSPPRLTPQEINQALRALPSDDERLEAMDGICKCGSVTDGATCWACYESPSYD